MKLNEINLQQRYIAYLEQEKGLKKLYPTSDATKLSKELLESIVLDEISIIDPKVVATLCTNETYSHHLKAFLEYPMIKEAYGLYPWELSDKQAENLVSGESILTVLGEPTRLNPLEKIKFKEQIQYLGKRLPGSKDGNPHCFPKRARDSLRGPANKCDRLENH